MMKKEIMIVQRIFTDYRKALFDILSEKEDIIVVHSKNNSGIKQIETSYSKRVPCLKYGKNDTNVFMFLFVQIFIYKPKIIVHEFAIGILSLFFILLISKIFRIKLILWSHGYDRKKGFDPSKSFGDKIRLFYLKSADAVLLYGENDRNLLKQYVDEKKVFVAENTFDTARLIDIYKKLEEEGRTKIKERSGITFKYNLIFIGRLLKSKNPELLIDIFEKIKDKVSSDVGIHFIGDGPMLEPLKEIIDKKNYNVNFFFHGAIHDYEKTGELLYISDLMVMPGALGLSVIHAFCFGCPVVSFKSYGNLPSHGPEADYVINGKTGYLVDSKSEDINEIILEYLSNNDLQKSMRVSVLDFVKENCTLKKMSEKYIKCLDFCK